MHYYPLSSRGWRGSIVLFFRGFSRFGALLPAGHMPES
jgi:hypothetical protein